MLRFRIYFEVDGQEDHFDVSGKDVEVIRAKVLEELSSRGIPPSAAWSEELK